MKIRLLKTASVKELSDKIADNLEKYRTGNFLFLKEDTSTYFEIDQQVDEAKIAQIECQVDNDQEAENCEYILAAFPDMTPYLARDERIWTYLTHIDLLRYTRERWPIPEDKEKAISHIRAHFFANGTRGIERANAASRLWWMAHISAQCESLSLKDALQCLLFRSDVRANIIERPTTAQNSLILSAILEKLYASYHTDQQLFDREIFRNFMIELNLLGGVRLLDALNKETIEGIISSLVCV